jgi:hypothetical protein
MFRLASIIYTLASTTIMGVLIIAALTMGFVSSTAILAAVAAGLVLGLPVAWIVAKKLSEG